MAVNLMRICVQAKAAMPDSQAPKPKQSRLRVGSIGISTTLIYLCLAVLGCGGFAAFFSHPARDCPRGREYDNGKRGVLE